MREAGMPEAKTKHRLSLIGRVVSDKMKKTVVVEVERRKSHPLYHRIVRKTKRYKAHDEQGVAHLGDRVRIEETRPISKDKHFRVVEIVQHREVVEIPTELVTPTAESGA
ncbi:MAG: 30S ribosomal protein S17 [Chloroflexi bacterium]|nr:30S ribosomal protein S17 [Chloroflexota bacterium]